MSTVLVDAGNLGSLASVRRVFAGGVEAGDTENDQPLSTITRRKTFHVRKWSVQVEEYTQPTLLELGNKIVR